MNGTQCNNPQDDGSAGSISAINETRTPGSNPSGMFSAFATDFGPMEKKPTVLRAVDALLKRPARIVHEITRGNLARMTAILLIVTGVCLLGYGLVMGIFSGGHQLWAVPLKVVVGTLLSALICLPSLYIFMCLSGSEQSFAEVWGLFLASLALSAILLVGFAPVAWIFSQSTNAVGFMGGMHLVFWLTAAYFGLRLLKSAFAFLNKRDIAAFRLWGLIFIVVVMQMCTTLRPLVGEFQGFRLQDKKFFLMHWGTFSAKESSNRRM